MVSFKHTIWLVLYFTSVIYCDVIPDKICGKIYDKTNFQGQAFVLNDFDQSVNTKTDYRASISGWKNSGSIKLEEDCRAYVCNGTYFTGTCTPLTASQTLSSSVTSQINSVNCTCSRECRCEDKILAWNEYGRAYLTGGCNTCNSEHVGLSKASSRRYSIWGRQVEAFVIRSGCTLTAYSEPEFRGIATVISNEVFENFQTDFQSYQFACNETAYVPRVPVSGPNPYPPRIQLPQTAEGLIEIYSGNNKMTTHPGINAALMSLASGRSWRNAYILVIGYGTWDALGLKECSDVINGTIGECHISVDLDHLGISDASLRIIFHSKTIQYDDYRFMTSLDEYLSNHEELLDAIPNAVIIRHEVHHTGRAECRSNFRKKLEMLNALRTRVVDETYSNVIFELDCEDHDHSVEIDPKQIMDEFEGIIKKRWNFPKPMHIALYMYSKIGVVEINGFFKFASGVHWPRHTYESLELISEETEDELGLEIFKAASSTHVKKPQILYKEVSIISPNDDEVKHFREFVDSTASSTMKTILNSLAVGQFSAIVESLKTAKSLDMKLKIAMELNQETEKEQNNRIEELERKLEQEKLARELDMTKIKEELMEMMMDS